MTLTITEGEHKGKKVKVVTKKFLFGTMFFQVRGENFLVTLPARVLK